MSRRRIEQGASGASSFSLRTLQTAAPAPVAAPAHVARRGGEPPSLPTQTPGLNFRFSAITGAIPQAPKSVEAPKLPINVFGKPVGHAVQGAADVLRLTAVVDDLNQRNKKLSGIKAQLEGQVQRINATLVQERSSAASRIQALKQEVGAAQDAENRIRSELAVRPAAKEVDTNKFAASVRSALEQEETNARVADAEASVVALKKRYESLGAEVKLLEERKGVGIAAQSLSADEVELLVAKAAGAQAHMSELEDQHAVIQDSIAHLEALRSSHHKEVQAAEQSLSKANEATAASVADSVAAKEQVADLLCEQAEVTANIAALNQKLNDLNVVGARPATTVTGAAAPEGLLGQINATCAAQIDAISCCSDGVGYHFAHDCPIELTTVPTGEAANEVATQAMITAVVADLKGAFLYAAQEHSQIGAPATVGV